MKAVLALLLIGTTFVIAASASAATPEAKATYDASNSKAAADYKLASTHCDGLAGNPKDICVTQAKAARVQVEADATAQYKGTVSARSSARKDIADANYNVDKAKCAGQANNGKDVCLKQAKATMIAAKSDATADKKIMDARTDARDDKQTANYKVAVEKCDALAGSGKDACVASAKTKYGQ